MDIEEIVFEKIGYGSFKLKEVKVNHPMMNVHGLTRINGKYYREVSEPIDAQIKDRYRLDTNKPLINMGFPDPLKCW